MPTVTPLDPATKALRETSSDALLTSIEVLTHRIHGVNDARPINQAKLRDLRVQREMLRNEILRRIGSAS